MDTSRRGILRLMAGGAATAAVGPQQAAKALGVESALVAGSGSLVGATESGIAMPDITSSVYQAAGRLRSEIWQKQEALRSATAGHLPPHIQSKKSWSPTFKAAVYQHEERIMQAFLSKLDQEEGQLERFLSSIGIKIE